MTTPLFWERLARSGLFVPAAANSLRAQFHGAVGNGTSTQPGDAVGWLKKSGLISDFQGKLLLGGFAGSFSFGEYTLINRRPRVVGLATFAARHNPTRHEVQLAFVPGSTEGDADIWDTLASRSVLLRKCRQSSLLRVHETVELNDYRFAVMDASTELPFDERLGSKGRVPWPTASAIVIHLAQSLEEIHQLGIAHGNVNSREVFLEPNGFPRMAPPIWPTRLAQAAGSDATPVEFGRIVHYVRPESAGTAITVRDDVFSLATILFRAIRGETPTEYLMSQNLPTRDVSAALAKLAKYEVPSELTLLLRRSLDASSQDKIEAVSEFLQQLRSIPQVTAAKFSPSPQNASAEKFAQWLRRWRPADPELITNPSSRAKLREEAVLLRAPSIQGLALNRSTTLRERRKKKSTQANWGIWTTSAAALIATLFVIFQWNGPLANRDTATSNATTELPPVEPRKLPNPEVLPPTAVATGNWIQRIVEDNGQTLWQSPTNGPSIDLSHLPPGPSLLLVVRPSELARRPESANLSLAMGPRFQEYLAGLASELSLPFDSIEQLVIGFYPTERQVYEPFYRVRLGEARAREDIAARWSANGFLADPVNPEIWTMGETYYRLSGAQGDVASEKSATQGEALVDEFVCGSREFVESSQQVEAANPLTGPMAQLVARTDRDRHLTILGLKSGMFNESGQNLFPPQYRQLPKQLSQLVEDQVRAILFSVHWEDGTYAELAFDETADIRANALRDAVAGKWKIARDQLTTYLATQPADPYWEKVRQRFDDMLTDVSRQLRIGVEFDQVLLNVWLPAMAAHNLVAASEMTLSSNPGTAGAVATVKSKAPTDIQQLLQIRRTLQNEIRDDFPNLPFAFEIRLSNTDLQEAGITRNQRLTSLVLVDQTLDQVLTRICFQANPDKNATGPEDPRCTLIWVVTRDEEKNVDLILITTRAAAAKNGWKLQPAFDEI